MFTFSQATDLFTSQTRMYHNGIYTGTNYDFRWRPAGRHVPPARHLPRQEGQPQARQHVPLGACGGVRVDRAPAGGQAEGTGRDRRVLSRWGRADGPLGPGFIDFHFGDAPQRVGVQDLKECTMQDGSSSSSTGRQWYSLAGKYTIQ